MISGHRWALALLLLLLACASSSEAPATQSRPKTVRVAACQILVDGNRDSAFERVEAALGLAAEQGAQVACFPETSFFGWVNPEAHDEADGIPGATTERLGELARRYDMLIAIGLAEKSGDDLYDSAVLIDNTGDLLLHHRKVNVLAELMDPPYTTGLDAKRSVVSTRFGRIGMLVCADTFDEVVVGQIAAASPALVLVPYGWAAAAEAWPEHGESLTAWVKHTAQRVKAPVVGVDGTGSIQHGPWKGFLYGGQSPVCDRAGEVLGVLADRAPEVRTFEIELLEHRGD